jgi:hypothetical protein
MNTDAPRVFVSYAHEEPIHDDWVTGLTGKLRENGIDASLDRWDLRPGQDTTLFMESQIRDSDFVILVCTPLYREKSNVPRGGVGYEKNIISAEMLQARDLLPKFLPVLRKGTYDEALPTYLGSKYAIDFRDDEHFDGALTELLRAIFGQPHPEKPPVGQNPFTRSQDRLSRSIPEAAGLVGQDVDVWHKEVRGRFDHLREERITTGQNPFEHGFWQASFVLHKQPPPIDLNEFLQRLRAAKTGRTGWDVGWVPTRQGIAPYPYKGGIEVWLAESGDKGAGHSDFWRAEPTGRFALFRGYQEDEEQFPTRSPGMSLDYSLVLWRVSEILLYLQSFAAQLQVADAAAILALTWEGLAGRRIGHHDPLVAFDDLIDGRTCHQEAVTATCPIARCDEIKRSLVGDVRRITEPLFESFDFFAVAEADIKGIIKKLFDADKEGV